MPLPRMRTDGAQPITNDGTVPMAAPLSLGGNRIERLGPPTQPDDAARLADVSGGGAADEVTYDDSAVSPPLGAADVQGALDAVKGDLADRATSSASTYAPTITPVTPGTLVAAAAANFRYFRIGSMVHVMGTLNVTPASLAGDNQIDISLPVATASAADLTGVAAGSSLPGSSFDVMFVHGPVVGSGGNARVYFSLAIANAPGTQFKLPVSFSYTVS